MVLAGCAVGGDDLGLGGGSSGGVDGDVIVPEPPIEPPTGMTLVFPGSSPGFAVAPQIQINGVRVGDTANLYTDSTCSGTVYGSAVVSSGSSVVVTVSPDLSAAATYTFYSKMINGAAVSRCSSDVAVSATYVFDPSLGPAVTGLSDDAGPVNSKNWSWGCNKASCNYRFAVNTSPTHTFTVEPYIATSSNLHNTGNGTYYIHVQPRDNGTLIEGFVQTYSVLMDTVDPLLSSVSVSSNNGNSASLARPGDTLTLSFTSNESLGALPIVNINGSGVAVSDLGAGNYSATYNYTGADSDGLAGFTIDFVDVAGNNGLQVNSTTDLTQVVFDKTIPTLTSVSIASNNANPAAAVVGNTVTLDFTASEVLLPLPTVTINGNSRTPSHLGGGVYQVTHPITVSDPSAVVGFTIDFEDPSGNTGSQVTLTTDLSSVTVDSSVPTLSPVSISSNNGNPALARSGNIITVAFTGSEALQNVNGTIAGQVASILNVGGNNWTATYTMTGTDPEGTIGFSLNFQDMAGNPGTTVTGTTDLSQVVYDRTVPTLTAVSVTSNNANTALARTGDVFSLTFTTSEALSTLPTVNVNGTGRVPLNVGGNNYLVVHTITAGDPETAVGFTIDFSDDAGNAGTQVTATTDLSQVVVDRTAPSLSTVSIASNNGNPAVAIVGNIVTLSFTGNEALQSLPVVTINGNPRTVSHLGGNNYSATHTITAGDPQTAVAFTIDYNDAAGNIGSQVTTTTDLSSVTVDGSAPSLSPVSIVSNNGLDTSLARVGDLITLTFTGSEALQNVSVTIAGNVVVPSDLGGNNWQATYTMTGADTDGAVGFTIDFEDLSSISGIQVTGTTDLTSVTFDKTLPTLSPVSIASNNADTSLARVGDVITLSFTSDETLSAMPVATIHGNAAVEANPSGNNYTATYTMAAGDADGPVTFTIDFVDEAGNPGSQVLTVTDGSSVTFDKTAPTLSPVSIASNNADPTRAKVGDVITISFTSDEALIGMPVATIHGNAAVEANPSGNNYTATYTMTAGDANGPVTFTIDFTDAAGNPGSQVLTVTDGSSVTFDKDVPTLSTVSIASNNADTSLARVGDIITLSFTSSEALGAMPVATIHGNAAVEASPSGNNYTATYTMAAGDADGPVTFTIDFVDSSGNPGSQVVTVTDLTSVTFDKTVPTLTVVSIVSDNANPAIAIDTNIVTLTFTSSETLGALPVVNLMGAGAVVSDLGSNNYSTTYSVTGASADGLVPFTIDFADPSGNAGLQVNSSTDATNVTIDAPATITGVTASPDGAYDDTSDISFTVTFDKVVNVTAPPRIELTVGIVSRFADYASGTGSNTLIFTYDTQLGDQDDDGIAFVATSIALNGGTINNVLGPAADLDFTAVAPTISGITVDTNFPTVNITSAPNINISNQTVYTVSGTCSENGRNVDVNIGSINVVPVCLGGGWTTGAVNVSGLPEGTVTITADHDDAATNNAIQASVNRNKDTLTQSVAITSAPNIDAINETDYVVSGTCTGNGFIVSVSIGGILVTPNCTGGTWTTGNRDVSSLAEGPVTITADHLTATQDSVGVTKDTIAPTVGISVAANIVASNELIYTVSGECSESGQIVTVEVGSPAGIIATPTCSGAGTWNSGAMDVSSLGDGPTILITADHSTATQATTNVSKNTVSPSVVGLSVSSTLKDSADLNWSLDNPGGNTINDYEFNYRIKGTSTWLTFDDGISTALSTTITGLLSSTIYQFRARILYDTTLYSDWSNVAEGETKIDDPLFDGPYKAMNVGGSTTTRVVAMEDGTNVTLNGGAIAGGAMSKGEIRLLTTAQFDIIDADKPIFTGGRRGSGGAANKANIAWSPTEWAGKSFSFNSIREQRQRLFVYPVENTTVQIFQGGTLLVSATFNAGNTTPTSGTNPLVLSTASPATHPYGSYQVVSTGTALVYHIAGDAAGSRVVDPKPLPPASTEIIGFPSTRMRLTTNIDGTNYNFIHSNSTTGSGSLNKVGNIQINPQGTTSLYRSRSLIISADQPVSGASFADSNGFCAAPFLPTNLMRLRYAINTNADYVAFASKLPGTINVLDASDTVVEVLTLTRTGADPNAPYAVRTQTATGTTAGRRYVSTVPVAGWYQPNNDTGGADQDETILYGED